MAGDVQLYLDAAPFPKTNGAGTRVGQRRWRALLLVLAAHLAGLFWAVRNGIEVRDREAEKPIEVALIERPVSSPIPELRKAPPSPQHSPIVRPAVPSVSAKAKPSSTEPPAPSVSLFNTDGSLRMPPEAKAPRGLPEPDVIKGRELMSRGLDCEAPDALGSGESLGESVARKYLAWIGLYNSYSAQRRAELLEERKERCKRWRGQT